MSNHIRTLLDIQDQNIIFEDHCVKTGKFKGNDCKYVVGKLTYDPTHCKTCGVKNEDDIVTKNGTQMPRIILPITGIKPTYLLLKNNISYVKSVPVVLQLVHQLSKRIVIFENIRKSKSSSGMPKHNHCQRSLCITRDSSARDDEKRLSHLNHTISHSQNIFHLMSPST